MRLTQSLTIHGLGLFLAAGCAGTRSPDAPEAWVASAEGAGKAAVAPGPPTQDTLPRPGVAPASYVDRLQGTDITFKMIWIPEGNFWIGEREVTWAEYEPYCDFDVEKTTVPPDADAVAKPSKPLETFPYDREWGKGTRPAVGMSWNAAKKYCRWISLNTGHSYRLPTEAEWKRAAGPAVPEDQLGEFAWYDDNSDDMTHETGSKRPNAHGLYDVLGNLWEYTSEPYDPEQPEWALLKGGSWADPAEDAHPDVRLMFDEFWNLEDPNIPPGVWWVPDGDHVGFRLLRDGPKPADDSERNER